MLIGTLSDFAMNSLVSANNFVSSFPCTTILHCNIRSANRNIENLLALLAAHSFTYDLVATSETWLRPGEVINMPGYACVSTSRQTKHRGGGVSLYIKSSITFSLISQFSFAHSVEFDFLLVKCTDLLIAVVYRAPCRNMTSFLEHFEKLLMHMSSQKLKSVICGDFNIDSLAVSNTDYFNLIRSYGFHNVIKAPTRTTAESSSAIDHIYCNFDSSLSWCNVYNTAITDHFPIAMLLPRDTPVCRDDKKTYTKINFPLLKHQLEQVLNASSEPTDANIGYKTFQTNFTDAITYSTVKSIKKYHSTPICPWMTDAILDLIRQKDFWHTKCKQNRGNRYYFAKFRTFRNKVTSALRARKKEYYSQLIAKNSGNSKIVWRIINSIIRPTATTFIMPDIEVLGISLQTLVNSFNHYFSSICKNSTSGISSEHHLPPRVRNSFGFIDISPSEIVSVVNTMQAKSTTGCDKVSSVILKRCIDLISGPLAKIFNLSFHTATYPDVLKLARIVPIYKHGDQNLPENYRPISVLSCVNTLFEKLIAKRVTEFLHREEILTSCQHGFRVKRSTCTAVLNLSEKLNSFLNDNNSAIGIFLDIRKAFDTVNHDILLRKLQCYGFRGITLDFFRSYLSNRQQKVEISGVTSDVGAISSGVPQGSVLGPLLFSLYVNDLPDTLNVFSAVMYADDTVLLAAHHSPDELFKAANSEMDNVNNWFRSNGLQLNSSKTKFMVFQSPRTNRIEDTYAISLDGKCLDRVSTIKYLGVLLDEEFTWKPHIDSLCKKLSKSCHILYKCRQYFEIDTLRTIYYSTFQSHLTYCIECWGNTFSSYIQPLSVIQKRAIRLITSSEYNAHTKPLFKDLKIMPVDVLIKYKCTILVHRCITDNFPLPRSVFVTSRFNSRSAAKNNFLVAKNKNAYGDRRMQSIGVTLWNNLPINIKLARNVYSAIKTYFLSNP